MLESRAPLVSTDAHDQAGRGPRRNDAARAATPTASTAPARAEPAGLSGPKLGSRRCAQATKCTASWAALARARRAQPRTVEKGRPTRTAAVRAPAPPARATSARPITATVSTRRHSTRSGSNTCVLGQPRQRPRRGRSSTGPASERTNRGRAKDHGAKTPPQDGQLTRPATRSASTLAVSFSTMSTDASGITQRALSYSAKRKREGPYAYKDLLTLLLPGTTPQARVWSTTCSRSMSLCQRAVLKECVAQHPAGAAP